MIKTLHLTNFQAHKDTTFKFDPGLTVICGASGSGKSSVIRALKYLFYNRPNHVKYQRRPDGTYFNIEVEMDDCTISRTKGKVENKEVNQYKITFNDGKEPLLWEDVGRNVPDKITEISNIKPIIFNKENEFDIQLAKQFDGQFLLSEPDSVKLKFLNRLSGSYVVDLATKNVSKELSSCKKESENLESEIKELDKQLKNILEISGPFSIVLANIKEKFERLKENVEHLTKLKQLKVDFDQCESIRMSIISDECLLSKVNVEGFEFAINRLENLNNLYSDYKYVQEHLKLADNMISRVSGIQLDQLVAKTSLIADLTQLNGDYKVCVRDLNKLEEEQKTLDKQISNMVKCYTEQLKETPVCPYCNQKISKTCINKILKELGYDERTEKNETPEIN